MLIYKVKVDLTASKVWSNQMIWSFSKLNCNGPIWSLKIELMKWWLWQKKSRKNLQKNFQILAGVVAHMTCLKRLGADKAVHLKGRLQVEVMLITRYNTTLIWLKWMIQGLVSASRFRTVLIRHSKFSWGKIFSIHQWWVVQIDLVLIKPLL